MGTSGNWHYCVFPQGESAADKAFVEQLKRIRVQPLDGTFEAFTESLAAVGSMAVRLRDLGTTLVRVGPGSIEISTRELNSLRPVFEVLTMAHEENSPPPIEQTLRGQAEWSAFFNRQLLYRDAQETLESKLAAREHREADLHVVVAPVAWGKTYLLKQLAADRARRGDPTVWLNPTSVVDLPRPDGSTHSLGTWDFKAIRRVVRALTDTALAPRVLLIADDVPERISEVLAVLDYLRVENLHADIVFALRDTDWESAHADYPAVQSAHVTDLTLPTDPAAELERLLDLCAREGIGTLNDVPTRDLVRERIITERAHLLPLLALVMIFDKDHRRFEEIIGSLWAELASIELQDVLIRISVLHRYGNRYAPRLYPLIRSYPDNEREEVQNAVRRLLSKGFLFERTDMDEPVLSTVHSLFAAEFCKVSGDEPSGLDETALDVISHFSAHPYDRDFLRRLAKQLTDYDINMSTPRATEEYFTQAARITNNDAIICQQYAEIGFFDAPNSSVLFIG